MTEVQEVKYEDQSVLRDGINKAFMDSAGYAASIRTHYQTGSGVIRDIYELFYFNVAVLFDLTSDFEKMGSSIESVKNLEAWLNKPMTKFGEKDMEERCMTGLKVFRDYKISLTKNGIVSVTR
jgi:hypothetical protein